MKKKATDKKPAKRNWKLVPSKPPVTIRQISGKKSDATSVHLVREVKNCDTINHIFTSEEHVNAFLFKWELENQGNDPTRTGNWIDMIVTGISGEVYDTDDLEAL